MRLFRLEIKRVLKSRRTMILLAVAIVLSVLMAIIPIYYDMSFLFHPPLRFLYFFCWLFGLIANTKYHKLEGITNFQIGNMPDVKRRANVKMEIIYGKQ